MRINRMLKQMLGLVALTGALWLVFLYGRVLTSPMLFVAWLIASMLLGMGLWQRAKIRRRVWLAAYLQPESSAFRLLRGGVLMALGQGLVAIVMSLYLLLAVLRLEANWQWSALLCAAVALPIGALILARLLQAQVQAGFREELGLRLALNLLSGVLLLFFVWQALGAQYSDFREASIDQAVWYAVSGEQARSPVLLMLLEMAAASDALQAWLAQRLLPTPGSSVWQAAGWCIVLAREALFVWSYLLLCRGALALPLLLQRSPATSTEEPHGLR